MCASVCARVIVYYKFVSTICYKLLFGILTNSQRRCSWGQRWDDYILRLKDNSSGAQHDQIWSERGTLGLLKVMDSEVRVTDNLSGEGLLVDGFALKDHILY